MVKIKYDSDRVHMTNLKTAWAKREKTINDSQEKNKRRFKFDDSCQLGHKSFRLSESESLNSFSRLTRTLD